MMKKYAIFGGYGDQYWTNLAQPNFRGKCHGLTVCEVQDNGQMEKCFSNDGIESPATLVLSSDHQFIYAANETHDFIERGYGGGITAFRFDPETGSVEKINQSLSYGASPAYVFLDKTDKYLFAANHGSKFYCTSFVEKDGELVPKVLRDEGCVSMFAVREDGGIGKLLDRVVFEGTGIDPFDHASAHPHCVIIDDQDFIIIPDKGADCIHVCKLDRDHEKMQVLSTCKTELGSSPRHAAFVPGTDFVLVINEYDGHVCSYRLDRSGGTLTRISRLDCGDPSREFVHSIYQRKMHAWACDVQVHPNGRFVYTNIDQKILSLFCLDHSTGELTLQEQLDVDASSRGMQIDPEGKYLVTACMMSEKAEIYAIDQDSGRLTYHSSVDLPTPSALRFAYPN